MILLLSSASLPPYGQTPPLSGLRRNGRYSHRQSFFSRRAGGAREKFFHSHVHCKDTRPTRTRKYVFRYNVFKKKFSQSNYRFSFSSQNGVARQYVQCTAQSIIPTKRSPEYVLTMRCIFFPHSVLSSNRSCYRI